MVTDITERKRAEDQLRRSADRLAMLHDMDQAIVAAQSPAEIGRAALGRMRRMVPCQRCTVVLFDFERARGADDRRLFRRGSPAGDDRCRSSELCLGEVLRSGARALHRRPQPRWKIRLRSTVSCWPRACGPCSRFRSWSRARPSARSTCAPRPRRRSMPSTGTSPWRWQRPIAIAIQHARLREELARQTGELERRVAERGAAVRAADGRAGNRALLGLARPSSARCASCSASLVC